MDIWLYILVLIHQVYSEEMLRRTSLPAKDNVAFLELVLYRNDNKGDYITSTYRMEGKFANIGALVGAEGHVVQVCDL